MGVVYDFINKFNIDVQEWFENMIVIFDFLVNFDGYLCYFYWYCGVVMIVCDIDFGVCEYCEFWFGG